MYRQIFAEQVETPSAKLAETVPTMGSLDIIDVGIRFSERWDRIEGSRRNELLTHTLTGIFPSAYSHIYYKYGLPQLYKQVWETYVAIYSHTPSIAGAVLGRSV